MKKKGFEKIYVALPVLREFENLEKILISIFSQSYQNIKLIVCINQPDSWWTNTDKIEDCADNQKSLAFFKSLNNFPITIIDKSSKGNGWSEKKKGVGQARKIIFDHIASKAQDFDLIVSLDADTSFSTDYFQSLVDRFNKFPDAIGMSVPYHHPIENNEKINRAILRYEIYMRHYLLNLLRIGSPYAFTALGSGMVFPVWAYKKVNGITPLEAGEDFYFMQKLCKTGKLLLCNHEKVFPSPRISDRIPFGTGPAIQKGMDFHWESYPVYDHILFTKIKQTYDLFPVLFTQDVQTPLTNFLVRQLKSFDIWQPLRKNFKTEKLFINACHERLDGFRILQFLKQNQSFQKADEEYLKDFLLSFPETDSRKLKINDFSFRHSSIEELDHIRSILECIELDLRHKHDFENFQN